MINLGPSGRQAHRRRGALATLVVSALAITGCATGPTSSESSAGTSPAASTPVTSGGVLRIAASADAQPQFAMANRAGNWSWRRLVFDSLVEKDAAGKAQPLLATEWSYNDDRTELTLALQNGIVFHSGRTFTSADVVYSLKQVKDPASASQLAGVAAKIESVTTSGDDKVVIKLNTPSDSLFDLLDLTPIVDSETWAAAADGKKIIGTGPFMWESWTPGASIRLTKNNGYWGTGGPYLDSVEISIISDATALQSALKGKAADLALGLAQNDVALLKKDPSYVAADAGGVFYPFGFNVTQAPFDDPIARQAIGFALDRERIVDQVFGGDATVSDLWWTPDSPGFPADLAQHFSYDPAKAKELLEKSGASGAGLTITYANLPVMKSLFEIVQNNLSEVGLKVKAEALDVTEYDKRQVEGTLGQSFLLLHGMVGFSTATIIDAMPSIRAGNPSNFDVPEYDVLKTAVRQADDTTRDGAVRELTNFMLDQSFSHIMVVAPQYHVHTAAVQGLKVVSLGSLVATDVQLVK